MAADIRLSQSERRQITSVLARQGISGAWTAKLVVPLACAGDEDYAVALVSVGDVIVPVMLGRTDPSTTPIEALRKNLQDCLAIQRRTRTALLLLEDL